MSQESYEKHYPSITIGASALKFTGDVGKETDVSPLLDTRLGYYLAFEQRIGKVFGISLGGLYGKLSGHDFSKNSKRNFESKIMQGELLITANFDKVIKADPTVSPFLNAGIGFMTFDPFGDLKNGNTYYNYWNDGSIRDLAELPENLLTSTIIKRDYTFETQLKDSTNNYSRSSLIFPFGGGLNFHMGRHWTASLGLNYVICLSDHIDNYKKGGNDSYVQANVGIQYEFKPRKSEADRSVDFKEVDHLDTDEDGIGDDKDYCLGTPKNIPVDKHGCPFDTDKDGVADYMDKEPNSPKGVKVDGFGITFNEDSLAKHQLEWDSLYAERSEGFNETPSGDYLKEIENKSLSNNKNQDSKSKIPSELIEADLNKDGFISAEEITQTIDSFFEGTNDFTVEKINRLIDYFFEQ